MMRTPRKIIFLGNPGAGKTTMFNCLARRRLFRSGVSPGRGLTEQLQTAPVNGMIFVDTPGLHDVKSRKQAAKEIEEGLKLDGEYKLFFVMQLESGRIRTDDQALLSIVHEALRDTKVRSHYSIIFTKVKQQVWNRIQGVEAKQFTACLFPEDVPPTAFICPFYHDFELEDQDDAFKALPPDLERFILMDMPVITIESGLVKLLQVDKFEVLAAAIASMNNEIEKNQQLMEASLQTIKELVKEQAKMIEEMRRNESNNFWSFLGPVVAVAGFFLL